MLYLYSEAYLNRNRSVLRVFKIFCQVFRKCFQFNFEKLCKCVFWMWPCCNSLLFPFERATIIGHTFQTLETDGMSLKGVVHESIICCGIETLLEISGRQPRRRQWVFIISRCLPNFILVCSSVREATGVKTINSWTTPNFVQSISVQALIHSG